MKRKIGQMYSFNEPQSTLNLSVARKLPIFSIESSDPLTRGYYVGTKKQATKYALSKGIRPKTGVLRISRKTIRKTPVLVRIER